MIFLKKTPGYVVNRTKPQSVKELKNDLRVDKITSRLNKLIITTIPIQPHGFPGDELFIYPVAVYKIVIKMPANRLKDAIKITPTGKHPHMFSDGICWGQFREELLQIKKHKDWYWIAKRVLDFLNDFGRENRGPPLGFYSSWVDRRLKWQLEYMENDPKAKKKLKALNKIYRIKYEIHDTSEFR